MKYVDDNDVNIIQMWGKLFRKSILIEAAQMLNVVLANRIVMGEDHIIMHAVIHCGAVVVGLNLLGYSYFVNSQSIVQQYYSGATKVKNNVMLQFMQRVKMQLLTINENMYCK
jgi:hypothetical protein